VHTGAIESQSPFAAEGIIDGLEQSETEGQDATDQFGQKQSQGIHVAGSLAEEAMEPTPMPIANVAAGEDDLCHVAVSMGKDPAGYNLQEGLKRRSREDGSKMLQLVNERSGKFHGSASLPWCLFGLFGPDRMLKTGKEADITSSNTVIARTMRGGKLTNAYSNVYLTVLRQKMRNLNFGNARHSHVMSSVLDEGLALFAGLNVVPKRSFLTEYSCRIEPVCYPILMRDWFDTVSRSGLKWGTSFDLDSHTIPFHGNDALVEKHYISKRSHRQKGMLAFLTQDANTRVFCYANGDLGKDEQNDEILRFIEFWKQRTGHLPEELIFDSKLTTYANLNKLSRMGIQFITLRRRSKKLLEATALVPASAWRRIELESTSRAYKTPHVLDRRIKLHGYDDLLRQLTIAELGHEEPTLLLTNQLSRSAPHLIGRYAQRMLIENNIEDGINFFHTDALSSAVAMKVNCDLQLTLMASSLYRLLTVRIGNCYEVAKSRHLFRDFVDASAEISITEGEIVVRFQKHAHNPLLLAANFDKTDEMMPWLGRKRFRLVFG
jgi:Transposase DDE domain